LFEASVFILLVTYLRTHKLINKHAYGNSPQK
jgi:hypothetical protein